MIRWIRFIIGCSSDPLTPVELFLLVPSEFDSEEKFNYEMNSLDSSSIQASPSIFDCLFGLIWIRDL